MRLAESDGWGRSISALDLSPNPSPNRPHSSTTSSRPVSYIQLNVLRILASGNASTANVYRTSRQCPRLGDLRIQESFSLCLSGLGWKRHRF
jgi:hypothetical protein